MVKKSTAKSTVKPEQKNSPEKTENLDEFKQSLENDLRRYIDEKLDDRFIDRLDDMNKKLLREKSKKILTRNILIIILLALVGFETYVLYKEGVFDVFFNRTETEQIQSAELTSETSSSEEKKSPSLAELKEKYASLLDPFKLPKSSDYLSDFNSGNLTNDLKLYFALNSLDFNTLEVEEDYNFVSKASLISAAEKLFTSTDLEITSFSYNGNKLRFFEKLSAFVSSELLKKPDSENLVSLEISEIKEENDSVVIKTTDNLVFTFKDKKLVSLSKSN